MVCINIADLGGDPNVSDLHGVSEGYDTNVEIDSHQAEVGFHELVVCVR